LFSRAIKHSILQELLPAVVTSTRKKVTGRHPKKLMFSQKTQIQRDIIPQGTASTYSFACLPGWTADIKRGNRAVGCVQKPNG
jgi:hypothetical protein